MGHAIFSGQTLDRERAHLIPLGGDKSFNGFSPNQGQKGTPWQEMIETLLKTIISPSVRIQSKLEELFGSSGMNKCNRLSDLIHRYAA
jgi:hypothetical protein